MQAEDDTEGCGLRDALGLASRESEGAPVSDACALADALGEREGAGVRVGPSGVAVAHCDASAEEFRDAEGHAEAVDVVKTLAEIDMLGVADTGALAEAASEGDDESVGPSEVVTLCDADREGLKEADGHADAVEVVEAQLLSLAAPRLGVGRAPLALATALGVCPKDPLAHAVKEGVGLGEGEGLADADTEEEPDKVAEAEAEIEAVPVQKVEADVLGEGVSKAEGVGEAAGLRD